MVAERDGQLIITSHVPDVVITPLWSGLRERGFKEALAAENSVETA